MSKGRGRRLAISGYADLFNLGLSFAQFTLAMPFQHGAAFVGEQRVIEFCAAVFELTDDFFKLHHGIFEAERRDVSRQ